LGWFERQRSRHRGSLRSGGGRLASHSFIQRSRGSRCSHRRLDWRGNACFRRLPNFGRQQFVWLFSFTHRLSVPKTVSGRRMFFSWPFVVTAGLFAIVIGHADESADALVRDRIAVERVYYEHRTGTKPPFDQFMPRELTEKLVRQDLHKETALK